jgi:thymidylate synthase
MKNYTDLLNDILENGYEKKDRTGVGTKAVWGRTLRFDLSDTFPLLTTRPVPFRIAFEETMFFLRGETDTKKLEEKNIKIWTGNTTREFLDNRGLDYLPEGDMGKGYGWQWRHFGGYTEDEIFKMNFESPFRQLTSYYPSRGVDQVEQVIKGLRDDPDSRRHLITAWNPQQLGESALPPCHVMHQYQIMDGKLNSMFYMRSNDVYLGLPFNIASYAFLNRLFAEIVGVKSGELVYMGGDVHLYTNQLENAKLQIKREPRALPTLRFKKKVTEDTYLDLEWDDIEIIDYNPHPQLPKVPMAV